MDPKSLSTIHRLYSCLCLNVFDNIWARIFKASLWRRLMNYPSKPAIGGWLEDHLDDSLTPLTVGMTPTILLKGFDWNLYKRVRGRFSYPKTP